MTPEEQVRSALQEAHATLRTIPDNQKIGAMRNVLEPIADRLGVDAGDLELAYMTGLWDWITSGKYHEPPFTH